MTTPLEPAYRLPADALELAREMMRRGFAMAHQALRAHVADDELPQNVCSMAGIAVEICIKSCLIEKGPALLLDTKPNRMSLESVSGLRPVGPQIDFPTVGFAEALQRMRWVHPTFPFDPNTDSALLNNRNAAAHSGMVAATAPSESVRVMVRLLQWVHDNPFTAREGPSEYLQGFEWWGDNAEVARRLAEDDQDDLGIRVSGKIESAKREFEIRYKDVPQGQRKVLFSSLTNQRPDGEIDQEDDWQTITVHRNCPACGQVGWLVLDVDEIEYDVVYEDDEVSEAVAHRIGFPLDFKCPVCSFSVWRSEMAPAGFSDPVDFGWSS